MTFITIDSCLSFDKEYLNIKKLKHDSTTKYWINSFLLLATFISFQTYRAIYDKPRAWIWVLIGFTWIYPYFEKIFKKLFIYKWGNKIKLSDIKSTKVLNADNELEISLCIELLNKRKKIITFRKGENQINSFIETLQQKTSNANIEYAN